MVPNSVVFGQVRRIPNGHIKPGEIGKGSACALMHCVQCGLA
jgi:hypothetical protein